MSKLIVNLKPDADDSALIGFPFGKNQQVSAEYVGGADQIDSYEVEIDLGDADDTTSAQEQFLNTNPNVISYKVHTDVDELTRIIENTPYGVLAPYAGRYIISVNRDEERGGFFINYYVDGMPPHASERVKTARQAAEKVAEIADPKSAYEQGEEEV